ncbi:MrcB family domain-containing protein [Streptomyces sp. NPDC099050]|uniref:MrcB family domain-containing protein n=1 Tax=Streptomyces sp. NPDC099050 TaxID=3366100 RepID=UPI0038300CC7
MTMRDLLFEVAHTYDQAAGTGADVPAQKALRAVSSRIDLGVLEGWKVAGYGGNGGAAFAPWIGVFNLKINRDPKAGLYLAYIFSMDMKSVTLTLQQGVTDLSKRIKGKNAFLAHLEQQADHLYAALPTPLAEEWNHRPSFGPSKRPESYEAASVVARRYESAGLPSEEQLQQDLRVAEGFLQIAAEADAEMRAAREGEQTPAQLKRKRKRKPGVVPAVGFKPGNSAAYVANIAAHQQVKGRKHELLIEEFVTYIKGRDYEARNLQIHPKDLTLHLGEAGAVTAQEWLVEAKVMRNGNAASAVREAVGQLREYSYFLYREEGLEAPHLVALFSEDIGAYASYLEDQSIAAIWQTSDGWEGTTTAAAWGMVD